MSEKKSPGQWKMKWMPNGILFFGESIFLFSNNGLGVYSSLIQVVSIVVRFRFSHFKYCSINGRSSLQCTTHWCKIFPESGFWKCSCLRLKLRRYKDMQKEIRIIYFFFIFVDFSGRFSTLNESTRVYSRKAFIQLTSAKVVDRLRMMQ